MDYTENYSLREPQRGENVFVADLNYNAEQIDNLLYKNRRISTGAEWDENTQYHTGDLVVYNHVLYRALADTSGAWDSTKWTATNLSAEVLEAKASGGTEVIANPTGTATGNLTKVGIDGTVYAIPTGTEVEANPTASATDTLEKLGIGGTVYEIEGSEVIANPSGSATGTLEKLSVDGTIYSVEGGGGSTPLANNAGYHNSIYRGKSLGNTITDAQWASIRAGTFEDMYIGDYWTLPTTIDGTTSNRNYVIAGFDYWWNCGDSYPQGANYHHVVLVPSASLYNAQMNATNTTTGAYVGSAMYTTNLEAARTGISALFGNHLYSVRRLFATAVNSVGQATSWGWYTSSVDLMNEVMVYGTNVWSTSGFEVGVDRTILPLFAHNPASASIRASFWLRSVATPSYFANVLGNGTANCSNASNSVGVRPAFAIY